MFWVWFIIIGIIGRWLAGKTTIPKLRKAAPLEALQTLVVFGIISFTLIGLFGIARPLESGFLDFLAATLSWAAFVSLPELLKREGKKNNPKYYQELEQEIREEKKVVPKIRRPDKIFMDKTSFEFPLATKKFASPPDEGLADRLAESVEKHRLTEAATISTWTATPNYVTAQRQARSSLLGLLQVYCNAAQASPVVDESRMESLLSMTDVLAPAPPRPSLLSTPILDVGTAQPTAGVSSRFGSTPAKTLSEPLLSADLAANATDEETTDHTVGYTYKPKLIESKFSKPID